MAVLVQCDSGIKADYSGIVIYIKLWWHQVCYVEEIKSRLLFTVIHELLVNWWSRVFNSSCGAALG